MSKLPTLRTIKKYTKEIWFDTDTIVSMISSCVECIEAGHKKDVEIKGLLYGKSFDPHKGPRANRYYVRRTYVFQLAKREERKVTNSPWLRQKMDSFYRENYGDENLGSFHSHPKGSPNLSPTDRKKFPLYSLKFLVCLKSKKLVKDKNDQRGVQVSSRTEDYNSIAVSCLSDLQDENKQKATYRLNFELWGYYRYRTPRKEDYFSRVNIYVI